MAITYAQKQAPAQKKDVPSAASIYDTSSQSEALQRKADMANNATQRAEAPRPNNTGMPDNLKSGIESLSGFSMDDVRVHYNSSKPATVQALAYTQGTDIHVAPGQEKCLPHEAWHVAQQMAGRVAPTTNINGMPVNDNAGLEHEADVMGEKAAQCKNSKTRNDCNYEKKTLGRVSQLTTVYFGEKKYVEEEYGAFISLCQKNKHISLGVKPRNSKEFEYESWIPLKLEIRKKIIEKKINEKKDDILEKCCAKANIAGRDSVEQIVNALKEYKEKPPTAPSLVVKIPTEVTKWKNFIIEKRGTELECADSAEQCAWDMYNHVKTAGGSGTKYKIMINGLEETVFHYSQGEFGEYEKCCTVFFVYDGRLRSRKKIVGVGVHNSTTDSALYRLNWIDPSWSGVDPKNLHL